MRELQLNRISLDAIPAALEKARQYRSLQEPEQAESICLDILEVDDDNVEAKIILILALTDQFARSGQTHDAKRALNLARQLPGKYERLYYCGLITERRARAMLVVSMSRSFAWEYFQEAMELYEQAKTCNPDNNDDAILRWNACLRTVIRERLEPRSDRDEAHSQMEC